MLFCVLLDLKFFLTARKLSQKFCFKFRTFHANEPRKSATLTKTKQSESLCKHACATAIQNIYQVLVTIRLSAAATCRWAASFQHLSQQLFSSIKLYLLFVHTHSIISASRRLSIYDNQTIRCRAFNTTSHNVSLCSGVFSTD